MLRLKASEQRRGGLHLRVAEVAGADLVLFDMGPSLGALNRAAMLAADAIVVPVAPDLFSLRGLQNVGAALADWREAPYSPDRSVQPLGYILQQDVVHSDFRRFVHPDHPLRDAHEGCYAPA